MLMELGAFIQLMSGVRATFVIDTPMNIAMV